ncbi:hypothetical protein, partial [Pantoea ananatis]|uniref:hypothetical protein n=1 Tax=Pantoea ananas TaxID=553 RepID=UPI0023B20552
TEWKINAKKREFAHRLFPRRCNRLDVSEGHLPGGQYLEAAQGNGNPEKGTSDSRGIRKGASVFTLC